MSKLALTLEGEVRELVVGEETLHEESLKLQLLRQGRGAADGQVYLVRCRKIHQDLNIVDVVGHVEDIGRFVYNVTSSIIVCDSLAQMEVPGPVSATLDDLPSDGLAAVDARLLDDFVQLTDSMDPMYIIPRGLSA